MFASLGCLVLTLLPAATPPAHAQPAQGTIEGTVYNVTNGLPVGRVRVAVRETGREVLTDDYGHYTFQGMAPGDCQISITYIGFAPQSRTVTVTAGQTSVADFQLDRDGVSPRPPDGEKDGDVVMLERFAVVADQAMSAQAIAMNEQRYADNIKNVVAFEELGEQGLENIGNYMRFLPGVVVMEDGDNAGTVGLGGFPADMSVIQLDGAEMAGTGVGETSTRAISLQDVPMGNIERIEVSKVPTPDMPASGLGGSINLVTKIAIGAKRPSFSYNMYMNFNNRDGITFDGGPRQPTPATSPKYMQPSFSANLTLPVGKWLAFSVGATRTWSKLPTDNTPVENMNWRTKLGAAPPDEGGHLTYPTLNNSLWMQNVNISTTENLQLGVDIKLSRLDMLTLRVQRRDTTAKTSQYTFITRFQSGANASSGAADGSWMQSQLNNGTVEINSRNNNEAATTAFEMSARYQHLGPSWRIGGLVSHSDSDRTLGNNGKGYFNSVTTRIQRLNLRAEDLGRGDSILPGTYIITGTDGVPVENPMDIYDPNNYNWSGAGSQNGTYKTKRSSVRIDAERLLGSAFSVKAGGAYNRLGKDDRRTVENYTLVPTTNTFITDYGLADGPLVDMNERQINWINPVKAYEVFQAHPELFTLNSTAIQNNAQNSKRMVEAISAAYLMFRLKLIGNRLNMVSGVRYEKTGLDGWSMKHDRFAIYKRDEYGNLEKDSNGAFILITNNATERDQLTYKERALHDAQDYDGFYPSFNASFSITPNIVARAAYARTIGRPDVQYVVDGVRMPNLDDLPDVDSETGEQLPYRSVTAGNPGLLPWTANSFHLSLDTYARGGFGSIGVYRKYVKNFFQWVYRPASYETLSYYGIPDTDIEVMLQNDYHIRRYENMGDANLTGFELSYRQDLLFLPSWLRTVQVLVNYTYLKVDGKNAEDFLGFTPHVFSWGVNFIRPRYSIRLDCTYQGETKKTRMDVLGTSSMDTYQVSTYAYQNSYMRYGITAEYALAREFGIYINWGNIFGKDRYESRRGPIVVDYAELSSRTVMPSYITIGIKGRF